MTDHPKLYAGYNYSTINADELNGAGVNDPISPLLFDTFVGFKPLIITEEMLEVFDNTCPDYTVPADYPPLVLPAEDMEITVGGIWVDIVMAAPNNVIVLERGSRGLTIRPEPDTAVISKGDDTQTIRRRA